MFTIPVSFFGRLGIDSPERLRIEVLSGLVVGLALIPEAISFSVVAGVDPRVGLFAAFTMAVSIAITGGRPAMISGAAGSTALVLAPMSKAHGVDYLVAAVLLAGVVQVVLGFAGIAKLMRFVPRAVSVGFVNALGILLFVSQWPNLEHVPATVYVLVAAGIAIILLFPRLTKVVPAPLIAIVVLTALTVGLGMGSVPTVGDKGELPHSLPVLGLPGVPLSLHTLSIIALPAVTMAIVGLLETQMTARLVDEITDTPSDKDRESWGQGIANIVTGLFGGLGGCAMIGQTLLNVNGGARTRASTFLAGLFLLILVVGLNPIVSEIPMAALVAVMFVVAYSTFDWGSVSPAHLKRLPRSETTVMVVTVVLTVATNNLSIGVISGVVVAALLFARRVAHLVTVDRLPDPDGSSCLYIVHGEVFFASEQELIDSFSYAHDPPRVIVDFSRAHLWDAAAIAALDEIGAQYAKRGVAIEIAGLNEPSEELHERLSRRAASAL
jgi:sulfate permease, SulP family